MRHIIAFIRVFCNWGKMANLNDFDAESIADITTSRDFKLADADLVAALKRCIEEYECKFPGRKIIVTCTYRSPTEQRRLWAYGRNGDKRAIVTNCDGTIKKSDHNCFPAKAVDVAILDGGKVMYDEVYLYPLGVLARAAGLDWGGFWVKCSVCHSDPEGHGTDHEYRSFKDYPHIGIKKA